MSALITGGSGFIGTVLANRLSCKGIAVATVSRNPDRSRPWVTFAGDVRDAAAMRKLAVGHETVYHLAARVGPLANVRYHREAVTTLITGTANVVDACVLSGARLISLSTADVYGTSTADRLAEDAPLCFGPTSERRWSYGLGKALAEQIILEAVSSRGLDARIIRPFNIVGAGQATDQGAIFPSFAYAAASGGPLHVHGDGEQRRTFLGVEDFVLGLLRVAELPPDIGRGLILNLGHSSSVSVRMIADAFCQTASAVSGRQVEVVHDSTEGAIPERRNSVPDLIRARELIGWAPEHLTPFITLVREVYESALGRVPAPAEEVTA